MISAVLAACPGDRPLPTTLRVNAAAGLAVRLTLTRVQAHVLAMALR